MKRGHASIGSLACCHFPDPNGEDLGGPGRVRGTGQRSFLFVKLPATYTVCDAHAELDSNGTSSFFLRVLEKRGQFQSVNEHFVFVIVSNVCSVLCVCAVCLCCLCVCGVRDGALGCGGGGAKHARPPPPPPDAPLQIAYIHADDFDPSSEPLTIVTVSCDRIAVTGRITPQKDLQLRGCCTFVGSSSMQIDIDAMALPGRPQEGGPIAQVRPRGMQYPQQTTGRH